MLHVVGWLVGWLIQCFWGSFGFHRVPWKMLKSNTDHGNERYLIYCRKVIWEYFKLLRSGFLQHDVLKSDKNPPIFRWQLTGDTAKALARAGLGVSQQNVNAQKSWKIFTHLPPCQPPEENHRLQVFTFHSVKTRGYGGLLRLQKGWLVSLSPGYV